MRSARGQLIALCVEHLGGRMPQEINLPMDAMADLFAFCLWKEGQTKKK